MNRIKRLPVTKLLLSVLAQTGQVVIDLSTLLYDLKYHRGYYLRGGHALVKETQRLEEERAAKLALRRLQEANYVKAQKVGHKLLVTLTNKGLAATLATRLRQADMRSDKLTTVVIFDIPQTQNSARRQLRLLLRQGGFKKLQQSVWVSNNDTYQLMAVLIKKLKLNPWVNIFRARDFLNPIK